MLPAIVVGVLIGGIVNKIFPDYLLTIFLSLLLLVLIVSTWIKLCQIQKSEAEEFGPLCFGRKEKKTEEQDKAENK